MKITKLIIVQILLVISFFTGMFGIIAIGIYGFYALFLIVPLWVKVLMVSLILIVMNRIFCWWVDRIEKREKMEVGNE